MGRHSEFTAERRAEIVMAMLSREEPVSVLARRHGVTENTLYRWRDEFIAGGTAHLASGKSTKKQEQRRVEKLEKQLAERDQVIGELTIANRFLKTTNNPSSAQNGGRS